MKKSMIIVLILILISCGTPKVVQFTPLTPIKSENVITAYDLFRNADPEIRKKMPPNAMDIVVLGDDKVMAAFSLYEFQDIYWLSIYIYNNMDVPYILNASDFVLMDTNRTIFKRIEPHEAANIYLAKLSSYPPYLYEPKYKVSLNSTTTGYVSSSGYVSAQTTTTGNIYEDPYHQIGYNLGYLMGAAIIADYNKKISAIAGTIYSLGLVDGTGVPAKSGLQGGIYWLKSAILNKSVILRISSINYEVNFQPRKTIG